MSKVQRTRYGFPISPPRKRVSRQEIFRPTLGLHAGDVPQDLAPGFTPESRNFATEAGFIQPRSGLSSFASYTFNRPVLGGTELYDKSGAAAAFASSASTLAYFYPSVDSWSELSYITGTVAIASPDTLSGLSTDYFSTTQAYDANIEQTVAIASNGTNFAKFFQIASGTSTYSDFTWPWSLVSTKGAKAVAAVNERLCFFNTISSDGSSFPTRFLWSERGNIRGYSLNAGAGFQDLADMRGTGTAAVRLGDVIVLFSDQEVWVARPTLDDYAFRFDRISTALGCPYPRTAVATPLGVMFLARDLEVYLTDGSQIVPLGPAEQTGPSRIQSKLKNEVVGGTRAWSVYNAVERRYELYYATNEAASGFPTRALYFNIDDRSWMPQRFEHELTFGFDFEDPGTLTTWADLAGLQWGDVQQAWGSIGAGEDRRDIVTFGSAGTAYRLRSGETSDDGTAIDARWRSHGLNQADQMRQEHLTELWIDYTSESDSSASVYLSSDLGQSFDGGSAVNLPASGNNAFIAGWVTAQAPIFEVRVADGSRPKIGRFQATLRDAGRFRGSL